MLNRDGRTRVRITGWIAAIALAKPHLTLRSYLLRRGHGISGTFHPAYRPAATLDTNVLSTGYATSKDDDTGRILKL